MWVELLTGAKRVVDMLPIDAAPLLRQGLARRVDGPSVSHGEAGGAISSVVAPPATVQPAGTQRSRTAAGDRSRRAPAAERHSAHIASPSTTSTVTTPAAVWVHGVSTPSTGR